MGTRTKTPGPGGQGKGRPARRETTRRRPKGGAASREEGVLGSDEGIRALIQASPAAIVSVDPSGIVTSWSASAERLFGWTAQEALGRPNPIVPKGKQSEFLALVARVIAGEGFSGVRVRRQKKDGTLVDVSISTAPLLDEAGRVKGAMAMISDISAETRTERELEKATRQLARTERLETATRVVAKIAHDLNNLLIPVLGYPDLIRAELPPGSPALAFVEKMQRAAREIHGINQHLLALSRQDPSERRSVDLSLLVQELLARRKPPPRIAVSTDLASGLPPVLGEKGRLLRVLENLYENAIEAVGESGRIEIRTDEIRVGEPTGSFARIEPGEYARVAISDTGPGIPREHIDRIFEPFFTTKESTGRRRSGLGLSVVHSVVREHLGYVDVEPREGGGTTFLVYLPVAGAPTTPSGS
ncbi:MAG: PAS domain S-box protein [Planctomycetes bacterium]|nr:PAS domain S-box protein [Planctomycetota bacterium]